MKNNMVIALALAGFSFSTYAATPDTMWKNPGGFHFGVTGAYLQPNASGDDLAYGYPQTPNVLTNASSKMKLVNPNYYPAFGINVGYVFPNLVDVNLNYLYFNSSNTTSTSTINTGQTFTLENPNTDNEVGGPSAITGKASYRINQIDLMLGQSFVMYNTVLHPSVGLRYTELNRYENTSATLNADSVTDDVSGTVFTSNVVNQINEKSQFSGIGPLLGLDGSYHFGNGFELVGHIDGGLLVGNINTNNSQLSKGTIAGTGVTNVAYSNWSEDSTRRVVPVADIKLGAAYQFALDKPGCSNARIEAGWQVSQYWSSVDRTFAAGAGTANGNFIANLDGNTTTSDLGFNGPYINLIFNIA